MSSFQLSFYYLNYTNSGDISYFYTNFSGEIIDFDLL